MQKNSLAVSVVYNNLFPPTDWSREKCTHKSLSFSSPEITQKSLITKRSKIYLKATIQAVKKGAAKFGSPTQDG